MNASGTTTTFVAIALAGLTVNPFGVQAADGLVQPRPKSGDVIAAPSGGAAAHRNGPVLFKREGVTARDRSGPRARLPIDAVTTLASNLRVTPSANNVVMTFNGPPNTVPLLEIGKEAPLLGGDGRWAFAPGKGATAYPVGGDQEKGEYRIDIGFITELQPATVYYYVLNLRTHNTDPNARRQQVKGKFTAVSQHVRVVLMAVAVDNDSDPNGNGELMFVLWANGGEPVGGMRVAGDDKRLDWGEGWHSTLLAVEIPDAPDQLTLQVDGFDDDTLLNTFSLPGKPLTCPGSNRDAEWNTARAQFDLSAYPGASLNVPFTLYSMKNGEKSKRYFIVIPEPGNFTDSGGPLGDLTFRANGVIEVRRPLDPSAAAKTPAQPDPAAAPRPQPRAVLKKPVAPFVRR